jgi:hypothetical protein
MKFFLDTEFIERGNKYPVTLISIGIAAENGARMYAVSSEFDEADCNDWVKQNVLPELNVWGERSTVSEIADWTRGFVAHNSAGSKPEFWGYYCDYDWVVFAQMFGTMMDLPKGWPMYCRDLKQLCDDLGNPKLPEQTSTEHNALSDAIWNKQVYEFLMEVKRNA